MTLVANEHCALAAPPKRCPHYPQFCWASWRDNKHCPSFSFDLTTLLPKNTRVLG